MINRCSTLLIVPIATDGIAKHIGYFFLYNEIIIIAYISIHVCKYPVIATIVKLICALYRIQFEYYMSIDDFLNADKEY